MHYAWAGAAAGILLLTTESVFAATQVERCIGSFEDGQRTQKAGHLIDAGKLYAECAVDACPKAIRVDCTHAQSEVERALPTVTVVVRDSAGADIPATVTMDGAPFMPQPGHAVPVDPGVHRFEAKVDGKTQVTSATIAEGEKSRVVVITAPAAAAAPAEPTKLAAPDAETSRGYLVGPIVVGSIGVLTLAAGIGAFAFGASQSSKADEATAGALHASDPPTRNAYDLSAKTYGDAADQDKLIGEVLIASGVAVIAAAVIWYFVAKPEKKTARLSPVFTF